MAVLVRMDKRCWADRRRMSLMMSSCMVMPCRLVYSVKSLASRSTVLYISAMLFKPVSTLGRVHLLGPPGTCA